MVHRAIPGGYNPRDREATRTAVFGEVPFYKGPSQSPLPDDEKVDKSEIFDGYFGRYDVGKEGEITEGATKVQIGREEIPVN